MILAYNNKGILGIGQTKRQARENSNFETGDKVIYFEGNNINDKNLVRV